MAENLFRYSGGFVGTGAIFASIPGMRRRWQVYVLKMFLLLADRTYVLRVLPFTEPPIGYSEILKVAAMHDEGRLQTYYLWRQFLRSLYIPLQLLIKGTQVVATGPSGAQVSRIPHLPVLDDDGGLEEELEIFSDNDDDVRSEYKE